MLVRQKGHPGQLKLGTCQYNLTHSPMICLLIAALWSAGWVSYSGLLSPGTDPAGQSHPQKGRARPGFAVMDIKHLAHPAGCHLPGMCSTAVWGQLCPWPPAEGTDLPCAWGSPWGAQSAPSGGPPCLPGWPFLCPIRAQPGPEQPTSLQLRLVPHWGLLLSPHLPCSSHFLPGVVRAPSMGSFSTRGSPLLEQLHQSEAPRCPTLQVMARRVEGVEDHSPFNCVTNEGTPRGRGKGLWVQEVVCPRLTAGARNPFIGQDHFIFGWRGPGGREEEQRCQRRRAGAGRAGHAAAQASASNSGLTK